MDLDKNGVITKASVLCVTVQEEVCVCIHVYMRACVVGG
jgi:hypothetical protein